MTAFLRRLFGLPLAPTPRLRDIIERLDGVEADMAGLRKRVNKLQGLVTGGLRREEEAQDAPGRAIAGSGGVDPPRRVPPNRFRGF